MYNDMKEETETDTSESYSEHSAVNSSRSRFNTSDDIGHPILGGYISHPIIGGYISHPIIGGYQIYPV